MALATSVGIAVPLAASMGATGATIPEAEAPQSSPYPPVESTPYPMEAPTVISSMEAVKAGIPSGMSSQYLVVSPQVVEDLPQEYVAQPDDLSQYVTVEQLPPLQTSTKKNGGAGFKGVR